MGWMGERWGPGQNQGFTKNVEEERDSGCQAGNQSCLQSVPSWNLQPSGEDRKIKAKLQGSVIRTIVEFCTGCTASMKAPL